MKTKKYDHGELKALLPPPSILSTEFRHGVRAGIRQTSDLP